MGGDERLTRVAKRRFCIRAFWHACVLTGLIVLACGRSSPTNNAPQSDPGPAPDPAASVQLLLFGAPWCTECKQDLPAIQAELDALSPDVRAKISAKLFVTTSGNPAVPPSDEDAQRYKEALKLDFVAVADEWRWKAFRSYVGGAMVLPGAAVLDSEGSVLRAFRAGATSFIPREIVAFAVESAQ